MGAISLLKSDLRRLVGREVSVKDMIRWYFLPKGSCFPYQVWFRILQGCKNKRWLKYTVGIPVYLLYRHMGFKYGISANANIEVGPGLMIVHGYGVYLNCKRIGSNFTVYQGVTLGAGGQGGVPVILDNVTVYTGSVVVGDITLNSHCRVGANSFVARSVPEHVTIAGNPAAIIRK